MQSIYKILQPIYTFEQSLQSIYKIPCKDCSNVYIGETGRCFNTRLSEHKRDLKPINLAKLKEDDLNKKTALVKHCFNCEHRIDFGNFEILDYTVTLTMIKENF